jgi:hypothetical protein
MGSLKIKEEIMKEKLKTILMFVVLGGAIFLIDYARVVDCGYPEFRKCHSYLDHYFK